MTAMLRFPRLSWLFVAVLLTLARITCSAQADNDQGGHYKQLNLVSDLAGVAMLQDPDLTNAWGVSFSGMSPFWISDNGSGVATLYKVTYDAMGMVQVTKVGLTVTIPPGGAGTPSGQVFGGGFDGEFFIFVSEDGTISGWHTGTVADTLVPGSTASVYKGVTLAMNGSDHVLLAANFRAGTIDMFSPSTTVGGPLTLVGQFKDPMAPAGYAPFNVLNLNGTVYVTFAMQDAAKHDDVPGRGHGLVDTFDPSNKKFTRLITGSAVGGHVNQINSPWGLAIAPSTFGEHADQLLVGNFRSGTIMGFTPGGSFRGLLQGKGDEPIVIDGLWSLAFGNGGSAGRPETLYFTAGPDDENNGLFGSLDPVNENDDAQGQNEGN